ncbi:MAG: hypothetical protein HC767_09780 [Akkermansiaceae bacterium]|nr:hypothetical protein [Akkermansiaceae bacterium]
MIEDDFIAGRPAWERRRRRDGLPRFGRRDWLAPALATRTLRLDGTAAGAALDSRQ